MPAFVRSVREAMPGYGSASNNGSIIGNAQGAGTVTMTIPATGATTPSGGTAFNTAGGPPPTRGRGRIRTSAGGAGVTTTIQSVTVTDGVTTLVVFNMPITQANQLIDVCYEWNTDLNITSTTLTVVLAAAGATIDWEISLT